MTNLRYLSTAQFVLNILFRFYIFIGLLITLPVSIVFLLNSFTENIPTLHMYFIMDSYFYVLGVSALCTIFSVITYRNQKISVVVIRTLVLLVLTVCMIMGVTIANDMRTLYFNDNTQQINSLINKLIDQDSITFICFIVSNIFPMVIYLLLTITSILNLSKCKRITAKKQLIQTN